MYYTGVIEIFRDKKKKKPIYITVISSSWMPSRTCYLASASPYVWAP